MPTRTFRHGDKFWDITWDGGDVEITSGKWGTNGRAREQCFTSVVERDAFIAREVEKIAKKGFVESGEVAPAAEHASQASARAVASLRARVEATVRTAWLPAFEPGASGVGIVRGPMTLDRDEAWPACPCCGQRLSGVFELDLAGVPAPELRRDALAQLFWCEAWEGNHGSPCTASGGYLGRLHRRGPRREAYSARRSSPHVIAGWTKAREADPDHELRRELDELDDELLAELMRSAGAAPDEGDDHYVQLVRALGLEANRKHKLAGWPAFVQEPVPFAHQVFQIEMQPPFDMNLGDVGAGHLLLDSRGALSFTWACH